MLFRALRPSQVGIEKRSVPPVARGASRIDLSSVPAFSRAPIGLYPKLEVQQPGNALEVEADEVAGEVVDERKDSVADGVVDDAGGDDIAEGVMRAPADEGRSEAPPVVPSIVHDVLRQSGNALESSTREFMEQRIGHDFSRVRVHTDTAAAESAHALHARAYTVGRDVVFAAGQFAPDTTAGKTLLAHELTHVVQQRMGEPAVQRQDDKAKGTKKSTKKAPKKPKDATGLTISGVVAAGDPLSAATIADVNKAAKTTPSQFRHYVAYADVVKVGGSLAWRANNPGNLRGAPTKIASVPGAGGKFAVFASMADGRAAQKSLYLNTYGEQTVRAAIKHLTPPSENDTAGYLKALEKAGVKLDDTVKSQIDTLMSAVELNEGMIEGTLVPRTAAPAPAPSAPSPGQKGP